MSDRILTSADAARFPERTGGKAGNLAALERAGLPVPPWFCVSTAVLADVLARAGGALDAILAEAETAERKALAQVSARVHELLGRTGLSEDDRRQLLARFDATFAAGAFVAVRSSARGEDSAQDSFAGQLDSYLFVTRESVEERVLACFASAFSERALLYRRLRGLGRAKVEAAVVVQLMVDARAAGVLFTANPTTGERGEAVVAAGLGLGEGIVGDQVESDTYFLDLATGAVRERAVAEKRARVVFDRAKGKGTTSESVAREEGARPALEDRELALLAELGRKVEALHGGKPQDVEWARDAAGKLYLLQARPITTLAQERETVFDNANIVESYPGLSLPLTFTFARAGYEATFRQSSRGWGVPEWKIQENWDAHQNLVALLEGRMYYQILNWYRLVLLVPGFEGILPAWEKALGLKKRYVRAPAKLSLRRRLANLPLTLKVAWRTLVFFATMQSRVRAFERVFEDVQADFRSRPLASLEAHELVLLEERLARRVMPDYSVSVVNDFFAQQLYEGVRKLIGKWQLGDPLALRNDLFCGETGMESVEPVRSLLGLAAIARAEPAVRAAFEGKRPDASHSDAETLAEARRSPAFDAALKRHLELYGDRTLHELKLETPLAEDDPSFLVPLIRNFVRGGQDVAAMESREREIRQAADATVREKLAGHPVRRALFGFVLTKARQMVRNRENLRLARSRAFGMAKRVFRRLGAIFAERKLLAAADDVFYLGVDEVVGAVRGTGITKDLGALVEQRRREYEGYKKRSLAPRIVTHGVVASAKLEEAAPTVAPGTELLRGLGCSPGRVRGKAKVILDPRADLEVSGEILVAPMTDPGWVFLMVAARGIVVEKGSPLSHTAIIGRELGIPTVVGVVGATERIATGDEIEIDGQTGTVQLEQDGKPASSVRPPA